MDGGVQTRNYSFPCAVEIAIGVRVVRHYYMLHVSYMELATDSHIPMVKKVPSEQRRKSLPEGPLDAVLFR